MSESPAEGKPSNSQTRAPTRDELDDETAVLQQQLVKIRDSAEEKRLNRKNDGWKWQVLFLVITTATAVLGAGSSAVFLADLAKTSLTVRVWVGVAGLLATALGVVGTTLGPKKRAVQNKLEQANWEALVARIDLDLSGFSRQPIEHQKAIVAAAISGRHLERLANATARN